MPEMQPESATRPGIVIVPAALFGIVLGLGGLGSAWRIATRLWPLPAAVGEALVLLAAAIWAVLLAMFARKWLSARAVAQREADDPVLAFSIGIVPMATMLVGVALKPYHQLLGWAIFIAGLVAGVLYAASLMGKSWQGGRASTASTPLMYLTPVGAGFLGAMGAGAYGQSDLAAFLWGAGAISWIIIEAAVLQRLMSEPLPVTLRATVGIQLAPPAVGCMSYLAFTAGPADLLAHALLGYALLQALIILRLSAWLREQPFGPGAWSYTFGLAALSVATLTMLERGQTGTMALLAPAIFIVANVAIGWIAVRTLMLALAGRLLPRQ